MTRETRPNVDPERSAPKNPFNHDEGLTGQSYSREREEALRQADPSGAVHREPDRPGDGGSDTHAAVSPVSGEVHGSGADAAEDPARKPGAWKPGAGKNRADR